MRKDYTHVTIVLDRSSSMNAIAREMEQGLRDFVKEQQKIPGKLTLSLFRFNEKVDKLFSFKDSEDLQKNDLVLQPSGLTALLDGIGEAISDTGRILAEMKEIDRPSKVITIIITDGDENSSKEYKKETINRMIKHQEKVYSWQFLFLGADQDAITKGKELGINTQSCLNFVSTPESTTDSLRYLSASVSNYRGGGTNKTVFRDPQDASQMKSNNLNDLTNLLVSSDSQNN
jgi:Mg-chelatase subunit ChlD